MQWTPGIALAALALATQSFGAPHTHRATPSDGIAWSEVESTGELRRDGDALLFPDGTCVAGAGAFELDARHRASAALRALLKVERDRARVRRDRVVLDGEGLRVEDASASGGGWVRALERGTALWWPTETDAVEHGSVVAYGAAFDGNVEHLAVALVGRALLFEHQEELAGRLDALSPAAPWIAAPGEYWADDVDTIAATLEAVRGAVFASAHVNAAAEELAALAFDDPRAAEALWQVGGTPATLAEAFAGLTPQSFHETHRALHDPAALRSVVLADAAPTEGFAFDLSRSAWQQGDDAGRRLALELLERLGGAGRWASAHTLRLDATSRTSTQLGDTVADSVTTRVLDGVLTHVSQQVEVQGRVQSLSLAFLGTHVLVRQGDTILERSGAAGARQMVTERRSLVRLLADLAERGPVGVRATDDSTLVLFDGHAELGTLELNEDGHVAAFGYDDAGSARRFEYGAPTEFGELSYPGSYREVGARDVSVTVTDLALLDGYDPALFRDPRSD